ncbi:MAG: MFS transporter [Ignavibacteriales bacterium]|nr:MFS transporter [Ignavibacteriales bacterium]
MTLQKNPPSSLFRWSIWLVISLAMFGNYYIYDSVSPLADLLKVQLNFSDSDIGWLNAIYSIPNIIMVLIGGVIIDKIGTRKSVTIFTFLIFLGAVLTALWGNFYTMAAGRLIFGLGAESMIVAITTIIARWFKGKELSFAFGLNLTVARFGSFLALNSPTWGRNLFDHWQNPLWVTVIAGTTAFVFILIYFVMDVYAVKKFDLPIEGQQDKIELKDIFKFSKSFWYISALCVTFYSAMFPFQTFAIKFFQEAHGTSREVGGNLSSLLTLSAMIFTPLFGLLSDKIGKRSYLMMFGALLIIPVYLIVPMSMMGIAFSLIPAVMWPSVALIVEEAKLGTAYGLMTMIQNIGLAAFNLIIGYANKFSNAGPDNPQGYTVGMWIFSILGFSGLFFAFLLKKTEKTTKGYSLDAPGK